MTTRGSLISMALSFDTLGCNLSGPVQRSVNGGLFLCLTDRGNEYILYAGTYGAWFSLIYGSVWECLGIIVYLSFRVHTSTCAFRKVSLFVSAKGRTLEK